MNQEMTPVPDNIEYENTPSKENHDKRYQDGYKMGFLDGQVIGLLEALAIVLETKIKSLEVVNNELHK